MSRGQICLLGLGKSNLIDNCTGRLAHEAWACLQHSCHGPGNHQEKGRIAALYLNLTGIFASAQSRPSHQD